MRERAEGPTWAGSATLGRRGSSEDTAGACSLRAALLSLGCFSILLSLPHGVLTSYPMALLFLVPSACTPWSSNGPKQTSHHPFTTTENTSPCCSRAGGSAPGRGGWGGQAGDGPSTNGRPVAVGSLSEGLLSPSSTPSITARTWDHRDSRSFLIALAAS